ncbi:MAG TPA: hypothetical protein VHV10_04860 [Ktedonobacteraceae bacterium]|nr:hypothetical protein [Ktedonobacteraceae bacterium]
MKKRIRSPKKKQQDGLPLGIFAMAPPSPPPTNEGGDRKGKARDDADNRSSWSGWRRRSSLSARRMYRSGASKSEQRSQDNS